MQGDVRRAQYPLVREYTLISRLGVSISFKAHEGHIGLSGRVSKFLGQAGLRADRLWDSKLAPGGCATLGAVLLHPEELTKTQQFQERLGVLKGYPTLYLYISPFVGTLSTPTRCWLRGIAQGP